MRDDLYSNSPVVGRSTERLCRLISLDGLAPATHRVDFEHEILWLRETEALACLFIAGAARPLTSTSKHNDWHGHFTSHEEPLESAIRQAASGGLGVGSAMYWQAVVTLIDQPLLPGTGEKSLGRPGYRWPPRDWMLRCPETDAFIEWQRHPDRKSDRPIPVSLKSIEATYVIYRSDWTEEANASALAYARKAAFEGVPQK